MSLPKSRKYVSPNQKSIDLQKGVKKENFKCTKCFKEKPKSEGTSGTGGGSGDQKESSAKKKKNNRSKNNSKSGNSGGSGDSGGKPEQSWEGRQYDKIFGTGENATKIKNVLSDVKQQAKNTYNKAATKVKDANELVPLEPLVFAVGQ